MTNETVPLSKSILGILSQPNHLLPSFLWTVVLLRHTPNPSVPLLYRLASWVIHQNIYWSSAKAICSCSHSMSISRLPLLVLENLTWDVKSFTEVTAPASPVTKSYFFCLEGSQMSLARTNCIGGAATYLLILSVLTKRLTLPGQAHK